MESLLNELKRRNIFRVGLAYSVLAWLILQVGSVVVPYLALPGWTMPFLIFMLAIGMPLVLIFAWAFELTPEGLKRSGEVDAEASISVSTGKRLNQVTVGVLSVAVVFLLLDRFRSDIQDVPPAEMEVVAESDTGENLASIAVLPFVNMSSDEDQVHFSDGISEEILNVLAQIPGLHVTSRSSAFRYRGGEVHIPTVAEQLGVANILEGSVRRSGTRIRITAQLIEASSDKHLWSETYDRELTDVFKIQDEISAAIVDALYVHLGLEKPEVQRVKEVDLEAYALFLLGRKSFELRTSKSLNEAIEYFDQALAIAPEHAPSLSGKADSYMLLSNSNYGSFPILESLDIAEPLIARALELDPRLAEAHASRGLALWERGRREAALKAIDEAIALNPNLSRAWRWKGSILKSMLRYGESLESWQQADILNPVSPGLLASLSTYMLAYGRLDEAYKYRQRLESVAPDHDAFFALSNQFLLLEGEWAEAHKLVRQQYEAKPDVWQLTFHLSRDLLRAYDAADSTLSSREQLTLDSWVNPQVAWKSFNNSAPETMADPSAIGDAIRAGTILGKYDEVVQLVERSPELDLSVHSPLFDKNTPSFSPLLCLAVSLGETGDEEGKARLVSEFEILIAAISELGDSAAFATFLAEVHALKGDNDEAIAVLKIASEKGILEWWELANPAYDPLEGREDFQEIVRQVEAKVNAERAKLGWPPVTK